MLRNPFMLMPPTSGSTGCLGFFSSGTDFASAGFAATATVLVERAALVAVATTCVAMSPVGCVAGSDLDPSQPRNGIMKEEHAKSVEIVVFNLFIV
jgi:hypothetical protein